MSSDSSSTNTSLTRSLTKVKSKLSSKLKISSGNTNSSDDHYNNEEHILKAMKYDDIVDKSPQTSSDMLKSRSNSIIQMDEIKIPKSLSITSIKIPISSQNNQDTLQQSQSNSNNKRGSSTSIETQLNFDDNILSARSSMDQKNDQLNTPIESSASSDNSGEIIQETLLPPPIDTTNANIRSSGIKLLTPNSELRSPFNTIIEEQPFVLSPPISPKRQDSICCDPLSKLEALKQDTESHIQFEPQNTDFADAVALSILDKVDDSKNAEWKI